jgi:hypothetical protein
MTRQMIERRSVFAGMQRGGPSGRHRRTTDASTIDGIARDAPSAGEQTMDPNDILASDAPTGPARRPGCLIAGCPCRDARIVSHRRARFYAHLALVSGETARRVIPPDPTWRLPRSF